MLPLVTPDTAFFWDGTAAGELRIQRCAKCGALRHPPGPMCPACGEASDGGYAVAAGTGEVFSYVVHHHPPVPGKRLPMVVALVQLPEGVRILGEMPGVRPDQVRIGLPVRVTFTQIGDMSLPAWRPADGALPDLVIDVTPTFVIASALATRDFQDVHHDRDRAVTRGARDIFVNILTTTGLVQRYVSAWAPDAVIRAVHRAVAESFAATYGHIRDEQTAVLAVGKLGESGSPSTMEPTTLSFNRSSCATAPSCPKCKRREARMAEDFRNSCTSFLIMLSSGLAGAFTPGKHARGRRKLIILSGPIIRSSIAAFTHPPKGKTRKGHTDSPPGEPILPSRWLTDGI